MLTMESKSQNTMANSLPSNSNNNNQNPPDAGSSMQSQIGNQVPLLPVAMRAYQGQPRQQLLNQNIQNNIPTPALQGSSCLTSAMPGGGGGLPQTSMPSVGQNISLQNMQSISGVSQNSVANSMGQGVYAQNQQSSVQQSQSMLQQNPQSVLWQHTHLQPQSMLPQQQQILGQQPNSTSMYPTQLIGQQNIMSDMQQQRQLGQQNNISNLQQQPQQQLMGQQQLGLQGNVPGLQQKMLGTQSGNSIMQNNNQHPALMMQQTKVSMPPQQNQQNSTALLPSQGQHSQSGPLLPSQDQKQMLFQSQRPMPEAPSSSLDSTAHTGNANSGDWQEIYQKILTMKEAYLPELNEMFMKIAGKLQQPNSNLLQHQQLKQQEQQMLHNQLKQKFQQHQMQEQMIHKQQWQQQHILQQKLQQNAQVQENQMSQNHQMNDMGMKMRQQFGVNGGGFQQNQRSMYHPQQLKSGSQYPNSSPQILQAGEAPGGQGL